MAGAEADDDKKKASPFKKLLKRMNPKKKKRRRKMLKAQKAAAAAEEEKGRQAGGVLQARNQNTERASATSSLKQVESKPDPATAERAEEATSSPPSPASDSAVTHDVAPVLPTKEAAKEVESVGGKLGLFECAGILCAAVESIPLLVTSTISVLGGRRVQASA